MFTAKEAVMENSICEEEHLNKDTYTSLAVPLPINKNCEMDQASCESPKSGAQDFHDTRKYSENTPLFPSENPQAYNEGLVHLFTRRIANLLRRIGTLKRSARSERGLREQIEIELAQKAVELDERKRDLENIKHLQERELERFVARKVSSLKKHLSFNFKRAILFAARK